MQSCPDPEVLAEFAAGRLDGALLESVADHVDACPQCQAQIQSAPFDADLMQTALSQSPGGQELFLREQGCAAALARFLKVQCPAEEKTFGPDADLESADVPRTVAGRYRLGEEIARGGMGCILRIRDEDFDRFLAMKVLLKRGGDLEARFLCEARLTGLLQHPGIPAVHALGRLEDGRPYFVMKLIQGESLQALLKTRSAIASCADLPRLLGIFEPICQTVGYAHARGVIHRDLKPGNIMVGAFGEVQVIDWGLAKYLGTRTQSSELDENETACRLARSAPFSDSTLAGSILGTPAYMAPEQARGEVDDLKANADVFGLGAILCEILTGKPPFVGPRALEQARQGNLQEALQRLAGCGVDAELIELARRCLAPRREDRPASGALVAEAVASYQAELARRLQQAEIARASELARAAQERKLHEAEKAKANAERRRRRTLQALAATALILLAVVAAAYWVTDLIRTERDLAIDNQKLAEKSEERARQAERENKILSHLGQAMALRQGHQHGRRARALEEIRAAVLLGPSAALREQLRNEAIGCMTISLDASPGKQWDGVPLDVGHFDFDGKLERYVYADRKGSVSVRRVADAAELARIDDRKGETWPRLSPDGRFLVTFAKGWANVWKLEENPPSLLVRRSADSFAFHPDQPFLVVGLKNGSLETFDLSEGKTSLVVKKLGVRANLLAWRPHAQQVAVAHSKGVKVFDLVTQQWVANLDLTVVPRDHLAWHPEGNVLALACSDSRVRLWNVDKNRVLALEKQVGLGIAMAFNHRGNLLATNAWGEVLRLWDPRTGKHLEQLAWGNEEIPRFGPDDRLLAARSRENSLQFWEIATPTEYRTLIRDFSSFGGLYHSASIGLEGRLLAVGMNDGVALWDLKTTAFLAVLPTGVTRSVVFDHSSRSLYVNGTKGVARWPVRADAKSGQVRIGPPQALLLPNNTVQLDVSRTDDVLVQAGNLDGARALRQNPERMLSMMPHRDVRYVSISPDSRLIATGTHTGAGLRIWDAQDGKLVQEISPQLPSGSVQFSGDGLWLANSSPACQLWKVGTWERGRQFSGTQFGFAPDGKLLAVENGRGVIRLYAPSSGQELALLEDPSREPAWRIFFSPDGTQLATLSGGTYPIHVWNLRKIRRQLVELGLDWEMPAYPPESSAWSSASLRFQVEDR